MNVNKLVGKRLCPNGGPISEFTYKMKKINLRIANIPADMRNGNFSNTSQEKCNTQNLFGKQPEIKPASITKYKRTCLKLSSLFDCDHRFTNTDKNTVFVKDGNVLSAF